MSKGRMIPQLVTVRSFAHFPGGINTSRLLVIGGAKDWTTSFTSESITFTPFSGAWVC